MTDSTSLAVDSTELLAADSHLFGGQGGRDPYHEAAFRHVVTIFCNAPELHYLSPPTPVSLPTPLLGLWRDNARPAPLHGSTFSDAGIDRLYKKLASRFKRLTNEAQNARDIADWIRFQFSVPQLVDIFWQGGNRKQELQSAWQFIRRFGWSKDALYANIARRKPPLLAGHERAAADFTSATEYALAYAFHAFAKGRLYAHQLAGGASYHSHWLRRPALPRPPKDGIRASILPPAWMFPWGDLLVETRVFEENKRTRGEASVRYGLQRIRELTSRYPADVIAGFKRTQLLVDYAKTGLAAAKWLPRARAFNDRLLRVFDRFFVGLSRDTMELGPKVGLPTLGVCSIVQEFRSEIERLALGLTRRTAEAPIRLHHLPDTVVDPAVQRIVLRYMREIQPKTQGLNPDLSATADEDESA